MKDAISIKILVTAIVMVLLVGVMPGVQVANYNPVIWVVLVIAILNMIVRPILIEYTLLVAILFLGLFLFVINAVIVGLAGGLIVGFTVSSFIVAMLFSVLLTVFRGPC